MSLRILALESSGMSGEVALLEGDQVVCQQALAAGERTAQSLAPGVQAALDAAGWSPRDVELVAVTIGPGSFTGLRVGVTMAKTFAYAIGCEVLGVDTLQVIASQAPLAPGRQLWSVLDGQRGQLFAAKFAAGEKHWQQVAAAHIIDADAWLASLGAGDLVTGSGLKRLLPKLAPDSVISQELWEPQAATLGGLAWRDYQAGRRDDVWKLAPVYLRASAAEEKAAAS
jgi:tRNA threonylcarbamoyladenosine biosynthesis protein TsaB